MLSRTFLPMMLTVAAAMGCYYLLDAKAGLPDFVSISGGIGVGALGAIAVSKLMKRKE